MDIRFKTENVVKFLSMEGDLLFYAESLCHDKYWADIYVSNLRFKLIANEGLQIENFQEYCYTAIRNEFLSHKREIKRNKVTNEANGDELNDGHLNNIIPHGDVAKLQTTEQKFLEEVYAYVSTLKEIYQITFILFFIRNRTGPEVANILEKSIDHVYMNKRIVIKKIRKHFKIAGGSLGDMSNPFGIHDTYLDRIEHITSIGYETPNIPQIMFDIDSEKKAKHGKRQSK